jgi:hypothetical protein
MVNSSSKKHLRTENPKKFDTLEYLGGNTKTLTMRRLSMGYLKGLGEGGRG